MAKTDFTSGLAKIKVIGLGGGGSNAISRMVRAGILGVEFIVGNTDAQALMVTEAPTRIQLGKRITRGLGCGGDDVLGQKAAEESLEELREVVLGADMVFIACGMGGGTGTGAAPVVARIAKESGALTIAVVTKPFSFEGGHRAKVAEEGIASLLPEVDTLIIIPNDRLFELCDNKTAVDNAFKLADDVLTNSVQVISEVITVPGLINLDFADIRAVMKDAGPAWMSFGTGTGANRAVDAAKAALASPLLDVSIAGAKGVLYNVVGDSSLTLLEVNEAAKIIKQAVDPEANIIFGVTQDSTMDKEIKITLIATGFAKDKKSLGYDFEFSESFKNLKDNEEELDIPSFLRRPSFRYRRQIMTTPYVAVEKTAVPVPQTS